VRTQRHLLQTTRGVSYTCCLRAPCTAPSAADLAALIPTRTCTKHSCWRDTHVLTSTSRTPPQLATPLRRTCTHLGVVHLGQHSSLAATTTRCTCLYTPRRPPEKYPTHRAVHRAHLSFTSANTLHALTQTRTRTHLWSCPPRSTLVFSCKHNTLHCLNTSRRPPRESPTHCAAHRAHLPPTSVQLSHTLTQAVRQTH
jgi:hypothetical protein